MVDFLFKGLLQEDGWKENVRLITDSKGIIKTIEENVTGESFQNFAVPGFQNAHSHAFQYAMAGLAELHSTSQSKNDFWSWRKIMYELALNITPLQMENIATMLYKEMLRNGYTHVAEFHYLHHDLNGEPFKNLSEMGERLISAAKRAGIKITLVPIFYQNGGFGRKPENEQRRFLSETFDDYTKLIASSASSVKNYKYASLAYGIHSMRAVSTENIIRLSQIKPKETPFHIHVSEQLKEIEDSINFLGARPVDWLTDNLNLDENYHLVHATHLSQFEIEKIAKSKANVVLCPSTEGNLGDGIFPLKDYLEQSGRWSIGTDSHVGLNPFEELRILDYGQRLTTHNRNTFGNEKSGDNGNIAILTALINGRKAMGIDQKKHFEVGAPFDALIISDQHPLIQTASLKNLSNTLVYSSDTSMYKGTIVNGEWKIKDGIHLDQTISSSFVSAIKSLAIR